MNFRKEVEDLFKKAGWTKGREVNQKYDSIPRFSEYPEFAKKFLYEYGDLIVETFKYKPDDVTGTLDFKHILDENFNIGLDIDTKASFGHDLTTYPLAYYSLENAYLECDSNGVVYMNHDYPCIMSFDFKEGIEKVIMEDYSNTILWDEFKEKWENKK